MDCSNKALDICFGQEAAKIEEVKVKADQPGSDPCTLGQSTWQILSLTSDIFTAS